MRRLLPGFLLLAASTAFAAAPEGVPRSLALERARAVSDVQYRLQFALVPHADSTAGHEDLRFKLDRPAPLLLDYREGAATHLSVNGRSVPVVAENGHLALPADALRAGENEVALDFVSPVAPAGRAITRYEDRDDGSEYLYTLFVPMDASMAFPCFDQPDLKGRFQLEITAPDAWTVVSNTAVAATAPAGSGTRRTRFGETVPISTYLFAFAAGPFRNVHRTPGLPDLYVRQSRAKQAEGEAPEVQQVTAQGIGHLSSFFAQPFPFPKYDMVVIPGLAYGGMEHAGATFLREESILFRTAPTHSDRLNRDILLLHELTHQWFGDFTTMRWFDDLWLKEGFAQYMAYQTLDALKPDENMWKRFYLSIKPAAYGIDVTKGTTPIYQDIPNLKDAKSAYGAIVYSKAPGLLRQLAFVLGEDHFRDGLRLYLKEHPYGNAEWNDLVHAFERTSGRSLATWADAWIRRRGMPEVDAAWSCDAQGRLDRLALSQHDVLGGGGLWPVSMQVLLGYADRPPLRLRANLEGRDVNVREAVGRPCPRYVFANGRDYAYGRFLLDPRSRAAVMDDLGGVHDLFERTLLWGSLWESVREAQMAPRDYLDLALRLAPSETDEQLVQSLGTHVETALHYYVDPGVRGSFVPGFEEVSTDRMLHAEDQGLRIVWFRTLRGVAESDRGRAELKHLLDGSLAVPGVELRPLDRWSLVTTLIALRDPDADAVFAAEQKRDQTGDGRKYAYMAEAARPDEATKRRYFDDYLHDAARPEDWIEQSLGTFNEWNQSELTRPWLRPALDALPQVKQQRKIFFVLGWLNAFIGGQQSPAAQAEVHDWLRTAHLDRDLQLKVLEVVDQLDRTVRIRQRYP